MFLHKLLLFSTISFCLFAAVAHADPDDDKDTYVDLKGNMYMLCGFKNSNCQKMLQCRPLLDVRSELVRDQAGPGSAKATTDIVYVNSTKDFHHALGTSMSVSFGRAFASADLSARYKGEESISSEKCMAIISAEQDFTWERFPDVQLSEHAKSLGPERILELCGDQIITAQQRAARFFVVLSIENDVASQSTSIQTELSVNVCGYGGGSGTFDSFSRQYAKSGKRSVTFISHGLETLAASEAGVRAAICIKGCPLEEIEELAKAHFKACLVENGLPMRFKTVPTRYLMMLAELDTIQREVYAQHPQIGDVFYMMRDFEGTADQCFALSRDQTVPKPRRDYFAKYAKPFRKAQIAMRSLGLFLLSNPRAGFQKTPKEVSALKHMEPFRWDWCPHIKDYDLIAESSFFANHLDSDFGALLEYKRTCSVPLMRFQVGKAGSKTLVYVVFMPSEEMKNNGV